MPNPASYPIETRTDIQRLAAHCATVQNDPNPDRNDLRASWAITALLTHANLINNVGEPLETIFTDLLTDLRHASDAIGLDFFRLLDQSYDHYVAEVHDDDGDL